MKFLKSAVMSAMALSLSACGGNSGASNETSPPITYTIGGSISGLSGSGLTLQDNGGDNLAVSADGTFHFATPVASGGAYNVTVITQPSSPAQVCTVTEGTGTATANITTIQVICAAVTYTIGGSVSGLSGSGLTLQDNGGDNLAVSANGTFQFATPVASGGAYNVTVLTQPSSPAQVCTVTEGSGTAAADVTNIGVGCSAAAIHDEWTWMGGSKTYPGLASYGVKGVAAPTNVPGSRMSAIRWTDAAGNFWLFGGFGTPASGNIGLLDDLWKYSAGEWTWMSGPSTTGLFGVYGVLGVAAAGNIPGGRTASLSWIDSAGNLWLFGGSGIDSLGNDGELNDLWEYSAGQWTWQGGSSSAGQSGVYGVMGTASPGNIPGARDSAFSWTDPSGNFWLFGGDGFDSTGALGQLNDLWEYSAGQWTWIGGPSIVNQAGNYGTLGVSAPGNIPGSRDSGVSATDPAGNFWLFGGRSVDASHLSSDFNDLWEYSGGQWTWVSGASIADQTGVYGTKGVADPANVPGARRDALGMFDANGTFWLFGGEDNSNDLWKYSGDEWTWVNGAATGFQTGVYGTLGTPAPDNVPGGRSLSVGWMDSSGNIWLFGGNGIDSAGTSGNLNDLWRYTP